MEQLIKLILVNLSVICCVSVNAQYRVVLDKDAIKQVMENTAFQIGIETLHNIELDSILSKQKSLAEKSLTLQAISILEKQTLQNTNDFDVESTYYKEIERTAKNIAEMTPDLLSAIKNSKFVNQLNFTSRAIDLGLKCSQYVNDYVNIVNNGKVKNPLEGSYLSDNVVVSNDGDNYLDRYERLGIAKKIADDLKSINNELNYMLFLCSYGDWTDLVKSVDRETWVNMNTSKTFSDDLIKRWNNLAK